MKTITISHGYTLLELKTELERFTGNIPRSTFYYRVSKLGLIPNDEGLYDESDLQVLKDADKFLKKNKNLAKFIKFHLE